MKFAVIEYSSKTGAIWKHTSERPNYLCDPVKEIDPTSFGCYVSALQGEHIPLLALIKPNFYKKVIKRLSGSWPGQYDLSYLEPFDALLVVYQISDGHEMVRLVKRLKKEFPDKVIVGVPTQPWGLLEIHWNKNPQAKSEIVDFMNACDVFLTIVKSTQERWQAMTKTPVEYLPQPYPVEYAERHFLSRERKDNVIFVAGVTDRPNIIKGHRIAKQLQQEFPEYVIHVTKIDGMPLDTSELEGSPYKVMPFELWQEHLWSMSKVKLVINTDYTQTRGRVQVDCAAVGTPSIGADSDGQIDLFSDLPADSKQTEEELLAQARRLLIEPEFYDAVAQKAKERLRACNYEESARRLTAVIQRFRQQ
ncbi:MAG: hypothetical protein WD200_03765 [Candidatus Andersenbacteria bacterium]